MAELIPGSIGWTDLTISNADEIRDFYSAVAGWRAEPVRMGDYDDYCMMSSDHKAVAGICHKRGKNALVPSQWLVYLVVPDIEKAMSACLERGGEILDGPRVMDGQSQFCVIKDPAGAVAALYQPG